MTGLAKYAAAQSRLAAYGAGCQQQADCVNAGRTRRGLVGNSTYLAARCQQESTGGPGRECGPSHRTEKCTAEGGEVDEDLGRGPASFPSRRQALNVHAVYNGFPGPGRLGGAAGE